MGIVAKRIGGAIMELSAKDYREVVSGRIVRFRDVDFEIKSDDRRKIYLLTDREASEEIGKIFISNDPYPGISYFHRTDNIQDSIDRMANIEQVIGVHLEQRRRLLELMQKAQEAQLC